MPSYQDKEFFVGIDPSLTGNAVVIINDKGELIQEKLISTYKECYLCPEQRILDIFNDVKFIANIRKLHSVCIEGLSYMSASPTLFERCALLYSMTMFMFDRDIKYKVVPPMTLKKFVTDNGHAKKDQMMESIRTRWGIDFKDDNLADAYGLARLALADRRNGDVK